MPLRIFIVDDNASFVAAATRLLDGSEFAVVGQSTTAAEALQQIGELDLDVVLLDIDLGEDSGFTLARQLAERFNGAAPAMVMVSAHPYEEFAELVAESPAVGFISKSDLSRSKLADLLRASRSTPGA